VTECQIDATYLARPSVTADRSAGPSCSCHLPCMYAVTTALLLPADKPVCPSVCHPHP